MTSGSPSVDPLPPIPAAPAARLPGQRGRRALPLPRPQGPDLLYLRKASNLPGEHWALLTLWY